MRLPHLPLTLFAGAALAAALAGCSRNSGGGPTGPPLAASRARAMPVPVTVAAVAQKDIPVQLRAIGTVRPLASVSIKARVDGQLARVAFKPGDPVKQGDLLFEIDPRPFQAALRQAEAAVARDRAALANAEADMRRTDELAGTKAVPATLVDANRARTATLKASVEVGLAGVESARLQLSFCTILSPLDGRIGFLLVDEGNMVKNNDTVLAVANRMQPIYVDFTVSERLVPEVREAAARARLRVEAARPDRPEEAVAGELEVVNNQVDTTTGTLSLRARFANADERMWPGQFQNVTLTLGRMEGAAVVPSEAVQASQSGEFVFVVTPAQTAEKRLVSLGPVHEGQVVVLKGVSVGETVVTDGQLRLVPGAKVDVRKPGVPGRAAPPEARRPA